MKLLQRILLTILQFIIGLLLATFKNKQVRLACIYGTIFATSFVIAANISAMTITNKLKKIDSKSLGMILPSKYSIVPSYPTPTPEGTMESLSPIHTIPVYRYAPYKNFHTPIPTPIPTTIPEEVWEPTQTILYYIGEPVSPPKFYTSLPSTIFTPNPDSKRFENIKGGDNLRKKKRIR